MYTTGDKAFSRTRRVSKRGYGKWLKVYANKRQGLVLPFLSICPRSGPIRHFFVVLCLFLRSMYRVILYLRQTLDCKLRCRIHCRESLSNSFLKVTSKMMMTGLVQPMLSSHCTKRQSWKKSRRKNLLTRF